MSVALPLFDLRTLAESERDRRLLVARDYAARGDYHAVARALARARSCAPVASADSLALLRACVTAADAQARGGAAARRS